jgi:hypothetical protein
MDGKIILRAQLENARDLCADLVQSMTRDEWLARTHPRGVMLGFIAWHIPATTDWAVQAWLRDVPELRTQAPLAGRPGINPPCTAFGMPSAEADEVARTVSRDDVLAYTSAAFGAAIAWLDAASEGDLTTDTDAFERLTSAAHQQQPAYVEEVASMRGLPAWRMLVSPCFGHIRGHLGELDAALTALRTR